MTKLCPVAWTPLGCTLGNRPTGRFHGTSASIHLSSAQWPSGPDTLGQAIPHTPKWTVSDLAQANYAKTNWLPGQSSAHKSGFAPLEAPRLSPTLHWSWQSLSSTGTSFGGKPLTLTLTMSQPTPCLHPHKNAATIGGNSTQLVIWNLPPVKSSKHYSYYNNLITPHSQLTPGLSLWCWTSPSVT